MNIETTSVITEKADNNNKKQQFLVDSIYIKIQGDALSIIANKE